MGYTKAAVIFQKGADYNEGLAENFVNEFESLGGTIVDQETYSEGDVDYKTQLTTILGKAPEVVFCPNYYQEVGQILAQAESIGLAVPFLGGDGWDGLEGYATDAQLKDAYFCANYAKGSNPDFENAYKAEYGEEYPNGFAPLGYDAAMTVVYGIQAAEDAGLAAGDDDSSRPSSMPSQAAPSMASPAPSPSMSTTTPSSRPLSCASTVQPPF